MTLANIDYSESGQGSEAIGVDIKQLSKSFGDREILQKIDLQITAGSFHILIGPSGCGKTTLLRLIGGLEIPNEGDIGFCYSGSKEVTKTRPNANELSYGFQEPRLLPWLTVADNVGLPLHLSGMIEDQRRPIVEEVLDKVGLSHASKLYPRQLSGGMKMRAAIARSLVTQPKILLLDEPFGALDEITKNRLDDELLELWKNLKMTVILVTHSLSEAVYLGQNIHVLAPNPGRVEHSLTISFDERTPELRLTAEFTEQVAEAHKWLRKAEGV